MTNARFSLYPRVHESPKISDDLEAWLKEPPPWRRLDSVELTKRGVPSTKRAAERGRTYVSHGAEAELRVNVALLLRRPLLVTGPPGIGKSSLAYHIAWCLGLGDPLRWEINSRTVLQDGLYSYDAIAHLRHVQSQQSGSTDIGQFITLGPLGTALLPTARPRVLLVDELDKASYDLPNDLLHVFEEGSFAIPELVRAGGSATVTPIDPIGDGDRAAIDRGIVRTRHHPVIVITSNAEREFPLAFRRRCVPLDLGQPGPDQLTRIVQQQLGELAPQIVEEAIKRHAGQATDVLLQTLFLQTRFKADGEVVHKALERPAT